MTGMSQNAQYKNLFYDPHYSRAAILTIQYMIYFYIGQRISGGMVNPVVSFAMVLAKRLTIVQGALYIAVQWTGGYLGALMHAYFAYPNKPTGQWRFYGDYEGEISSRCARDS